MTLVGNGLSGDDIQNFQGENSIQEYYYYAIDGNTLPFSLPQNMHNSLGLRVDNFIK